MTKLTKNIIPLILSLIMIFLVSAPIFATHATKRAETPETPETPERTERTERTQIATRPERTERNRSVSWECIKTVEEPFLNNDFSVIESENLDRFRAEFLEAHDNSVMSYDQMLNSFKRNKNGDITYPEYYGGAFIDSDGTLNVYIKDSGLARSSESAELTQPLSINGAIIREANYSYNELTKMMDSLNEFVANNRDNDVEVSFHSFYLSQTDNEIVIELENLSDEKIALFKNTVIDSPMITFVEETSSIEFQVNPRRM